MDLVWFGASGFAIYVLFDLEKERLKLEKSFKILLKMDTLFNCENQKIK